ncbi:MAG: hypothetical protein DSZ00_01170 [Gammaproteobacteria bacterium]|nr:MAG: hypothetical protein DSZ00_01170 [Gammaproteobacteria bacterium]RTZ80736.1 MAG: hypothetical protein DSZ01_01805 [Gammaproteobacteria bacterium]
MKKTVLILLFLLLPPAHGAGTASNNPFVDMMRSMLDMFEMMQLYQDFSSQTGRSPYPPVSRWPSPVPAPPSSSTLPPFSPQSTSELEGAWASNNNILFAIKDHLGRIYWARDKYRDFQLEILPPRLRLTDKDTGQSQEFDVSLQGDRLVLRDKQGRLALFRRIRGAEFPDSSQQQPQSHDRQHYREQAP